MSTSTRPSGTQYMILIYGDEQQWAQMSEADGRAELAEYMRYTQEMAEAGVLRAGAPLHPSGTATTVRVRDGRIATTDGPFAETKEQLGGYYVIETDGLDDALAWAARCPAARRGGSVEVRPVMDVPAMA
jgi:hypothetical protein